MSEFDPALYQPPFPYFGGKSRIASEVWQRFGNVPNYVEPFFGSGAVLFLRPDWPNTNIETINDKNGMVANFWRAIKNDPDGVADWADWSQNENDLHARHWWLKQQVVDLDRRLEGNPDYYDVKIAGWWVWGMCLWIGTGFCDLEVNGPWQPVDGQLIHLGNNGQGIWRQRIHLGNNGQGINRKRIHLGNNGRGINRKRIHLGNNSRGINRIHNYFNAIAERLRYVRVCSGDWARVLGPTPTTKLGSTAVFLDPPYASGKRDQKLYASEDTEVAQAVRRWAIENGDNPLLRIALCGYDGEHQMPDDWEMLEWSAGDSYGSSANSNNRHQERIWFSPHCLIPNRVEQLAMFEN